jgi:hypothetical protein
MLLLLLLLLLLPPRTKSAQSRRKYCMQCALAAAVCRVDAEKQRNLLKSRVTQLNVITSGFQHGFTVWEFDV